MKWWETIASIVGIGALVQLISWILDSLNVQETLGGPITLFLSTTFAILIIVVVILNQMQGENRRIVKFLKKQGYKEEESVTEKMLHPRKKKGYVDSRILWVIIGLLALYLIYRAIVG